MIPLWKFPNFFLYCTSEINTRTKYCLIIKLHTYRKNRFENKKKLIELGTNYIKLPVIALNFFNSFPKIPYN